LEKQGGGWRIQQTQFVGLPVSVVYEDPRNGWWWVALAHRHWGQKLHVSEDRGVHWRQVATPKFPEDARLPNGKAAGLRKVWTIEQAGFDRAGELYLGAEPGALFHTRDYGQSWQLARTLWEHPSRPEHWFGAGRDLAFLHSVVVDPRDSDHLYIAVSSAGVFETTDGGNSWQARNRGLVAAYLPNPRAEYGHDPHRIFACRSNPEVLWQQNHCGIFRSTDGGKGWRDVSGAGGFPYYGFALAIDHDEPERAWVIPAVSDEKRVAVDQALCVCRTNDGGQSWQAQRAGLPQQHAFDIVFRHSFAFDGPQLAFGSTTGNLFYSEDGGERWRCLHHYLPRVNYVVFGK